MESQEILKKLNAIIEQNKISFPSFLDKINQGIKEIIKIFNLGECKFLISNLNEVDKKKINSILSYFENLKNSVF